MRYSLSPERKSRRVISSSLYWPNSEGRPVTFVRVRGDLGQAQGLAVLAAVEDHVLHLVAPEVFCALFAEDPADGIGDVALAAAVGADHGRDAGLEPDKGFV